MSDNFHSLDGEEIEQDDMKTKLDLITITGARNIDDMNSATTANTTNITSLFSQTSGVGTSGLKTIIQNNTTQANTNTSNITTNATAIAGIASGLFDKMSYFIMNSPSYYAMVGGAHGGATTGSALTSFELGTAPHRFVIGSLGIVQDTYSPNNFSFSENDTKITFGWTEINVLVFYKMEHYDNSAGNRTIEFGMYDDYHNSNKFSVRHDVYMDSSSFRYKQISGFAGSIAIQSYANYYFWAKSNGGGKLQGVQFFLINATKAF